MHWVVLVVFVHRPYLNSICWIQGWCHEYIDIMKYLASRSSRCMDIYLLWSRRRVCDDQVVIRGVIRWLVICELSISQVCLEEKDYVHSWLSSRHHLLKREEKIQGWSRYWSTHKATRCTKWDHVSLGMVSNCPYSFVH